MVKNKIYNYITLEITKSFVLILFSLTLIAWTVRAVNFLDLIVDSGYSTSTYFFYSILNLTNILTKFIPLSFLLALLLTIIKLERQNEFLVLWTSGISKLKIANLFFRISLLVLFLYIIFSTILTPNALNLSRNLIKQSNVDTISNLLKPNVFADTFKGLTFYVGQKNQNYLKNIFIKDDGNNLDNLLPDKSGARKKNQTIIAQGGTISDNKLILEKGIIQSFDESNNVEIIQFNRTLLNFQDLDNRVIKDAKIQETSTIKVLKCFKDYHLGKLDEKTYIKNCPKNNIAIIIETVSRRLVMPLYIPVISIMISFLLIYQKNKKTKLLNRYLFFFLSFILLVLSELLVRYSGFSDLNFYTYLIAPFILFPIFYLILNKKFQGELSRRDGRFIDE